MFEGLLGRQPLFRVVDKDLLQKIEELFVECMILGNEFLKSLDKVD